MSELAKAHEAFEIKVLPFIRYFRPVKDNYYREIQRVKTIVLGRQRQPGCFVAERTICF